MPQANDPIAIASNVIETNKKHSIALRPLYTMKYIYLAILSCGHQCTTAVPPQVICKLISTVPNSPQLLPNQEPVSIEIALFQRPLAIKRPHENQPTLRRRSKRNCFLPKKLDAKQEL